MHIFMGRTIVEKSRGPEKIEKRFQGPENEIWSTLSDKTPTHPSSMSSDLNQITIRTSFCMTSEANTLKYRNEPVKLWKQKANAG